jgi:cell division septal protein FtsQ
MTTHPPDRPPAPTWLESMPRRVVSDKERGNSPKRHQSLDRYLGRTTGQQRGETCPWLASAVTIVGVLTTLVMYQQPDQSMVDGQAHRTTTPTVSAAGVPAGADMMAIPNAATHPNLDG